MNVKFLFLRGYSWLIEEKQSQNVESVLNKQKKKGLDIRVGVNIFAIKIIGNDLQK